MENLQFRSPDDRVPEVLTCFQAPHIFQGFDPQNIQARAKESFRSQAKKHSEALSRSVFDHNLVVVVKGTEIGGKFVEVGAQEMGLEFPQRLAQSEREKEELSGQGPFVRGFCTRVSWMLESAPSGNFLKMLFMRATAYCK